MDSRPRVLYLAHRVPYPPDKGDRIRNFHVLRELAKNARVWLACFADEPVTDETRKVLGDLCERVEIVPLGGLARKWNAAKSAFLGGSLSEGLFRSGAMRRLVNRWVAEAGFASALVSASSLAQYLRPLNLPRFVDLVDVDSQKWWDFYNRTRWPKRWLYFLEWYCVRKLEIEISKWTDAVFLVSRREADFYDSLAAPAKATVATNGVDLDYFAPQPDVIEQQACCFVGALDYLPNIDAAFWFAKDIWPEVRKKRPDAEFWIVGRRPVESVRKLAGLPGVKVYADVPDVRPYVAKAALAVCPIRIARGVQNKVLEAMAMGKATFAGEAAVAGLDVGFGEVPTPDTPEWWIELVCDFLDSAESRALLGTNARKYVETHHHWDRCLKPMMDAILAPAAVPR